MHACGVCYTASGSFAPHSIVKQNSWHRLTLQRQQCQRACSFKVSARLEPPGQAISNTGPYSARSNLSDKDGTARPQTRVPANDRAALSSSNPRPPVTPSVVRSYEVPLWDAMKFNGPAPEIINGRLAMIGIITAAFNEANYSQTVLQQVHHVPVRIAAAVVIVTYSSLVPILKGAKSEAFGAFTPRAEITNARAAMLGFAVLLLLENKSAVPFF